MLKNIPDKKNPKKEENFNDNTLSDDEATDNSVFDSNKEVEEKNAVKNISGFGQSNNFFDSFSKLFKKKKKVGNLGLLETNLIKDEIEIDFNWKKDLVIFCILLGVVIIFIIESYIVLTIWKNKKEIENSYYLETEITQITTEVNDLQSKYNEAIEFQNKLNLSSQVLNRHIYWTNFFSFLEKNTLKNNIYYKSFTGDIYGQYVLPTVSNNVLATNFQSKTFSANPSVNSASISDEEIINEEAGNKTFVNFNLNLDLKPIIFIN
jgi:hypothetical protein